MRHKEGTWRILESVATAIRNEKGQTGKLVIVNRDITERKRAEETLVHNAFHDGLTNLPNRALFLDRVQHALALSQRHKSYKFAVLFIDLDEFKVFNDSLGHAAGDALLIQIARRLTVSIRGVDTISRSVLIQGASPVASEASLARLGGDEFTILLEEIRDCGDAVRVAERIQGRLSIPYCCGRTKGCDDRQYRDRLLRNFIHQFRRRGARCRDSDVQSQAGRKSTLSGL